ncbi:MAG: DUF6263 family protein [Gemmatimonadaceae bacterium]
MIDRHPWRPGCMLGALAYIAMVGVAAAANAQNAGRNILLQIRPRVGDTLHLRFEQQEEMRGTGRLGSSVADTTITMTRSMVLLSRVLVQSSDDEGTVVLTVTDSVAISASGGRNAAPTESIRRSLQGSRVRMRITPEGSATVLDDAGALTPDLQSITAQMPASFPRHPVSVGSTWRQVMPIPVSGQATSGSAATLNSTFRLDSISRDGAVAFISMRGTLSRDPAAGGAAEEGIKITSSGSMKGTLVVDLKRKWWADSRATISLNSTLSPPGGASGEPIRVQSRISTWMRATKRPPPPTP